MGGQRVNGRYEVSADGGVHFIVWTDRNSPQTLQAFKKASAEGWNTGSLAVTIPDFLLFASNS